MAREPVESVYDIVAQEARDDYRGWRESESNDENHWWMHLDEPPV